METCVLIPYEFSLALTTNKTTKRNDITVWTMTEVQKGKLFYPFQGTIRTDKLENFKYLIENDVSKNNCLQYTYQNGLNF